MISALLSQALAPLVSGFIAKQLSRLRAVFRGRSFAPAPSPWLAGSTYRWHTHRHFAATQDRVDAHSARVAILILQFEPRAGSALLRAALLHDLGEYEVGDMSGPAKRRNPEIYAGVADLERRAVLALGLGAPGLSAREGALLKLCDGLDAYLWAIHHRPAYVRRSEAWRAVLVDLRRAARSLALVGKLNDILKGVCDGRA